MRGYPLDTQPLSAFSPCARRRIIHRWFLLTVLGWLMATPTEAADLKAHTEASGGSSSSSDSRARLVIGEPVAGVLGSTTFRLVIGFLARVPLPAPDTTPPTGAVTINGGAAYTNTPTVTLRLSATDDSGVVSQMQFSNDGATYTAPEPYTTTKTWTLTAGDRVKTVFAQFRDPAGNWSAPVSASITLDTTPPPLEIFLSPNADVTGAPP